MLFWPTMLTVCLLVSLGLASLPKPDGAAMTPSEARTVFLTVFALTVLVGSLLRMALTDRPHQVRYAMAGGAGLVTVALGHAFHEDLRYGVDALRGQVVPSLALSHSAGEVELRRGWDGHYRADAVVNGQPLRMMVDTGASMVLLPYEFVAEVGLDPRELSFSMPVSTANGQAAVAPINLRLIRVGPIAMVDVPAAVAPPGRLSVPLLGMTFLERLTETVFRADRLILRLDQRPPGQPRVFVEAHS